LVVGLWLPSFTVDLFRRQPNTCVITARDSDKNAMPHSLTKSSLQDP